MHHLASVPTPNTTQSISGFYIINSLRYIFAETITNGVYAPLDKIPFSDVPHKFFIDAAEDVFDDLINIGFFKLSTAKKLAYREEYRPAYKIGQKLHHQPMTFIYCQHDKKNCGCVKRPVLCQITAIDPHTFMGQNRAEYEIEIIDRHYKRKLHGGWTHEDTLWEFASSQQAVSWYIDESVIEVTNIRRAIKYGQMSVYDQITSIDLPNRPPDCQPHSAFYSKPERFDMFEDEYWRLHQRTGSTFDVYVIDDIRSLLQKTFLDVLQPHGKQKRFRQKRNRGTLTDRFLMQEGLKMNELDFDLKLKPFLLRNDIILHENKKSFTFKLPLTKIKELFDFDVILSEQRDGSQTKLTKDVELSYARKIPYLVVTEYEHKTANHHQVSLGAALEQREQDSDDESTNNLIEIAMDQDNDE